MLFRSRGRYYHDLEDIKFERVGTLHLYALEDILHSYVLSLMGYKTIVFS